ncbi:MAG: purine-nucleoside phosphorylase [Desulfovibrionaceae bacterium]|nr:purine-nucleoside phosphorylase [Desulfovibrionaceae bacterium]MBF0513181.1 purine-nucleoside phosphorylase [Desulfovibrionaceae bacterium]
MQNPTEVKRAAAVVCSELGPFPADVAGLVVGTGLAAVAGMIRVSASLPFAAVPGLPSPGVLSHEARIVRGEVGGRTVLACLGRVHLYEGRSPAQVAMQARVLAELGAGVVVLTNAAGALNPAYRAGELMLIADQINFTGQSPLSGPNHDPWGPRFPDCGALYPEALRRVAREAAANLGLALAEGVYLGLTGPSLETPAEVRAFQALGADALGMSTVIEALAAGHMGVKLLGVSCLTNSLAQAGEGPATLEAVIAQAQKSAGALAKLLEAVIPKL